MTSKNFVLIQVANNKPSIYWMPIDSVGGKATNSKKLSNLLGKGVPFGKAAKVSIKKPCNTSSNKPNSKRRKT
tara:strand:- start:1848 stop:2066 length:219 start_codon:yes stop_codon:yes gene_type:complete